MQSARNDFLFFLEAFLIIIRNVILDAEFAFEGKHAPSYGAHAPVRIFQSIFLKNRKLLF